MESTIKGGSKFASFSLSIFLWLITACASIVLSRSCSHSLTISIEKSSGALNTFSDAYRAPSSHIGIRISWVSIAQFVLVRSRAAKKVPAAVKAALNCPSNSASSCSCDWTSAMAAFLFSRRLANLASGDALSSARAMMARADRGAVGSNSQHFDATSHSFGPRNPNSSMKI